MNCPKCHTENEPGSKFCRSCGMNFQFNYGTVEYNNKTVDTTILIALIYMLASSLIGFSIQELVDNWYEPPFKYIQVGLNIIWASIPIILGIVIKNKTMKITGIIIGALEAIFLVYRNIDWLLD